MKVAIISPFHRTPKPWLDQCLTSVANQTAPCTHFLVCDGDEPDLTDIPHGLQVLRLPLPHRDFGNAARAIGSVSAICQGFDAIAYLDSDNWYEPHHVEQLCEAHQRTGAVICSCGRTLFDLQGQLLGPCLEVDGEEFVDTNCLFLTRKAFSFVAAWYLMPRSRVEVGDRIVWNAIKASPLHREHVKRATVNYRTRHRGHYLHFGKVPPLGTKDIIVRVGQCKVDAKHTKCLPPSVDFRKSATVALCMIVRNEQILLETCLLSVADLVDQMIVVDTGSTDRTKEIAAKCGASVFDFPWVDDFAAARNESLRHATAEWILWLDADESFDEENRHRLKRLLSRLDANNRVYMMKQWSLPLREGGSSLVVDQARLFRKLPGVNWRFRIHEQILPALRESGAKVVFTDIVLRHVGYQQATVRKQKFERNLALLLREHQERPDEGFTLFNLGGAYFDAGDLEKAVSYMQRCLETSPKGATFLPKAYAVLAQAHRNLGRLEEGFGFCQKGKALFQHAPELWFEEGLLCQANKDFPGAQRCFEQILQLPPRPSYVAVDPGLRGYLARHQLALACCGQGRPNDAEVHWHAVTQECLNFYPAWLGLAEIMLNQNRVTEVQELIDSLANESAASPIVAALRSHICLARGKYLDACQIMREAIGQTPRALWLRMFLSDMLIHEGKDLDDAEHQLREILAVDPNHKRAQHRLYELQQKRTSNKQVGSSQQVQEYPRRRLGFNSVFQLIRGRFKT